MSQLYGLSLLTKDNDQADLDTDETKFISSTTRPRTTAC